MDERIISIRESEKKSHLEIYASTPLFTEGSWLSKPIKTVEELFPYYEGKKKIRCLDLGCGVGRNCIPFAAYLQGNDCEIDCVDILDEAIAHLEKYSKTYGVENHIHGIVTPIEAFEIKENYYDLILGISSLEHVESEAVFRDLLNKIRDGVTKNGIVCFVINSEVAETDCVTQKRMEPQFEVNLSAETVKTYLEETYQGWERIKYSVTPQEYDIPRETMVHLTTNVVTWAARKIAEG